MPENQFEDFLHAVKADPELQSRLKDAKSAESIKKIAKEAGYEISINPDRVELTDDELELAVGGNFFDGLFGPGNGLWSWGCSTKGHTPKDVNCGGTYREPGPGQCG